MRNVLRWIVYLLAIGLGIAGVWGAVYPEPVAKGFVKIAHHLEGNLGRFIIGGIGISILCVHILLVIRWWRERRFAREIGYNNELGRVSVSLVAIEEALTRAIENEEGVRRIAIRVFEDRVKRQVNIDASLNLWETNNVTHINHRCQETLRRRFTELMPEKTAVQVHLSLQRMSTKKADEKSTRQAPLQQSTSHDEQTSDHPSNEYAAAMEPDEEDRRETLPDSVPLEDGDPDPQPVETQQPRAENGGKPVPTNGFREESVHEEDLYAGPTYPVGDPNDDDEESVSGAPLPPDRPDTDRP